VAPAISVVAQPAQELGTTFVSRGGGRGVRRPRGRRCSAGKRGRRPLPIAASR